jgi:hypothetical protein
MLVLVFEDRTGSGLAVATSSVRFRYRIGVVFNHLGERCYRETGVS